MRLFIATPLNKEITSKVLGYQPPKKEGVKLVRPDLLHMTLQFIGNEEPEKVDQALHDISFQRFDTSITKPGVFTLKKSKTILWLGTQLNTSLTALYSDISSRLLANNINLGSRNYTPHITLARCKKSIDEYYLARFLKQDIRPTRYPIDQFHLYHSYQLNGQLQYEPIRTYKSRATI